MRPLASSSVPNNLPEQITTFVGRERELGEVNRLLEGHRLVTLTGAGGTGKTRLALEAATQRLSRYPDGVWFVDLSPVSDPLSVPQSFGQALGVWEEPAKSQVEAIVSHLSGKNALLVVDNAEHVLEATASVCDAILRECPLIQILATGRTVLDLKDERTYRVPSMATPDPRVNYTPGKLEQFEAVRLFVDRASRTSPEFTVSRENSPLLSKIISRVDGIPLAIELAAAQVQSMSLDELARKLDERFNTLIRDGLGFMPRQQTLRAMIAWSYELLPEAEQRLLRRLSVFANGWRLEAAEEVCSDPTGSEGIDREEIRPLLQRLAEKALVQFDERTARFRLAETVRSYAKDALDETLEADYIKDCHLDYFSRFARETEPHVNGPDARTFLAQLDAEHENLRAAIDWGMKDGAPSALALACSLSTYFQVRGMFEEGCATYLALIEGREQENDLLVAEAHAALGVLLFRQGQFGLTRQHVGTALKIFAELGDKPGTAKALNTLAVVALQLKEYEEAAPLFERALRLFRELGEERRVAMTLNNLGILAVHMNDLPRARLLYEEALMVNRRAGNQRFEAGNLTNLADLALREGDPERARILARRACQLHLELGDRQNLQDTFEALAPAELMCGRPYVAALLFANKEALMLALGTNVAPFVAEEYRKNVEMVRQALGEETFRAAFTEGRSMTPEETFQASLEDL